MALLQASRGNLFPGDSEMARRMRQLDWTSTVVRPPEQWPENLRTAVSLCLTSRFPIVLWLGPQLGVLYNDAYIPFLGPAKHPRVLGRPGQECWGEIWHDIGPRLDTVLATGEATWLEDHLFFFARRLPLEEVYFTFTYSPIIAADGRGVDGVFCPCFETTEKVVAARRLETLRKLGVRTGEARSVTTVCREAAAVLRQNSQDVSFAAIYLVDERGKHLTLSAGGVPGAESHLPRRIGLDKTAASGWPLAEVVADQQARRVSLDAVGAQLSGTLWPEPIRESMILPVPAAGRDHPAGVLVLGVGQRRVLDDEYRTFFDLIAGQVGAALDKSLAYQSERRRAEGLAELDRAKTAFFSNVSHEFRTPLTLLLGPLEDCLADDGGSLPEAQRQRLEIAHRNSLRLLKLVNTLLEFSRIEAGRVQASYEPVDLGSLTADLASNFRAACEQAGIRLTILCRPDPASSDIAYVDRDMWEKIVLNLLSNAFKFTLEGSITVSLRLGGGRAQLSVVDTGTGIPATALPHLFERFYQVPGAEGRSREGSGIGLSLVSELVKLHGGVVRVTSAPGTGSHFTVSIPLGKAHLPADRIAPRRHRASIAASTRSFVEEALRWLPGSAPSRGIDGPALISPLEPQHQASRLGRPRILWADDNADMREYVERLLGPSYEVQAVTNGELALEAARISPPDLVLSDVMMPRMDGFELLRELRSDPKTRDLPVILVSARAGEESRIEGLQAGADDYLVKPFSARELLARVAGALRLAEVRRKALLQEQQLRGELVDLLENMTDGFMAVDQDWTIRYVNAAAEIDNNRKRETLLGRNLWEAFPGLAGTDFEHHLRRGMKERVAIKAEAYYSPYGRWYAMTVYPIKEHQLGFYGREITEQKRAAEVQLRLQHERDDVLQRLNLQFERMPIGCIVFDTDFKVIQWNPAAETIFGYSREEALGRDGLEFLVTPEVRASSSALRQRLLAGALAAHSVNQNTTRDGRSIIGEWYNTPLRNAEGDVVAVLSMVQDITERQQVDEQLRESRARLTADLAAMTRLQQVSTRMMPSSESTTMLLEIVDAAIAVTGADMGNIQLFEGSSRTLRTLASRGFEQSFLDFFESLPEDYAAFGAAMQQGKRVVVEDVTTSSLFAGDPALEAVLEAGIRAVQSTPLVARSGRLVGMLSTHCRLVHQPSERELGVLDLLARQAADWIVRTQAEQALQASEERFRGYFEMGLIGMAITSPTKAVLEVNDRLCEILGYTRTELQQMDWAQITHPEDLAADETQFTRVMAGEIDGYSLDKRFVRKDGGIVHTAISVNCIRKLDGSVDYFMALVLDITERKQAEGALRESEERYRSLISQVRDYAIFSTNETGVVTTWNEGCQQVLGYPQEEFIGLDSARLFTAEDRAADVPAQQLQEAMTAGGVRNERWMRVNGGGQVYVMGTTTALTDPAGQLIGFSMVMRDMTLMKRSQDELAKRGEKLAERLRLSERMASMGTLSAGLGHDLGNLLLPIDVRLRLLLEADLPPELRDHVAGIEKASQYLHRLGAGLRSLAMDPEADFDGEPTELLQWWNDTRMVFGNQLPRGIAFEQVVLEKPCWVEMKHVSLTQVVFNLMQNAADALRERGTGTVRVSVIDDPAAGMVQLRVADDGPGMSQDVVRRCMDPYFSTKPRGVSTGLGLAFVHRLVTGAGGRIEIDTAPGQGTAISLSLPRGRPAERGGGGPAALGHQLLVRGYHNQRFSVHLSRASVLEARGDPRNVRLLDHDDQGGLSRPERLLQLLRICTRNPGPGRARARSIGVRRALAQQGRDAVDGLGCPLISSSVTLLPVLLNLNLPAPVLAGNRVVRLGPLYVDRPSRRVGWRRLLVCCRLGGGCLAQTGHGILGRGRVGEDDNEESQGRSVLRGDLLRRPSAGSDYREDREHQGPDHLSDPRAFGRAVHAIPPLS